MQCHPRRYRYRGVEVGVRRRRDGPDRGYLAKLAHDVRAPLSSIKGYVGLLSERTFGDLPAEQAEILRMTQNNTVRIEEIRGPGSPRATTSGRRAGQVD